MGNLVWVLLALISVFVVWIVGRWKRASTLWERLGVPGPKPTFLIGNLSERLSNSLPDLHLKWMHQYGKVHGHYVGFTPFLTIIDNDLVKQVLVKDFAYFMNRQLPVTDHELFNQNLVFTEGESWKRARAITTPAFTSGKLRSMAPLMNQCIDQLVDFFEGTIKTREGVFDVKKVIAGFTMDVIASTSFATQTNANSDQSSENVFVKHGKGVFHLPPLRGAALFFLPRPLLTLLGIRTFGPEVHFNYFEKLTREIVRQRKCDAAKRANDLLQLMIDAEVEESVVSSDAFDTLTVSADHEGVKYDDNTSSTKSRLSKVKKLSENEVIANSIIFLVGGFDTTTSTISHILYELAINPEIQDKLYTELSTAIGDLDSNSPEYFDTVNGQIAYFEAVIKETLRLFPPLLHLHRRLNVDSYKLGNIPLKRDQVVTIPVHAIHHNWDYYPDPDKFDPNRWMPENKHLLKSYTYLPFGAGPRNCIGMRFAYQEIKLALARLILKYRFEPLASTPRKLTFAKATPLLRTDAFELKIVKRF